MAERVISIKITSDGKAFVVDQGANADAAAKLGRQVEDTGRKIEGMGTKAARAGREARDATTGVDRLADAVKKVGHYASGAIGVGLFAGWAGQVVQAMDAVSALDSRLKLVTAQESAVRRLRGEIYGIAQDTRTSMTELGNTYATLAKNGQQLGYSQDRLLNVSKAVGQALAIGGGAAQGQSAALVQLSQGLASGTLRGEELNSILEQTPRLAQAIADGMGITVGQLRAYGQEGKISALAVLDALEKSAPKLDAEFQKVKPTISGAFLTVRNSAAVFSAQLDTTLDISGRLSGVLTKLASGIEGVGSTMQRHSVVINGVLGAIGGAAALAGVARMGVMLKGVTTAVGALGVTLLANPAVLALLGIGAVVGGGAAAFEAYKKTTSGIEQTNAALERQAAVIKKNLDGGRLDEAQRAENLATLAKVNQSLADNRAQLALLHAEEAKGDGSFDKAEGRRLTNVAGVTPFPGAKPLEEVSKYVQLRNDILREGNEKAVDIAKSFANRIAGTTDNDTRIALEKERDARLIQLHKDTRQQLAAYDKAQSRDGDQQSERRIAAVEASYRLEQLVVADGLDAVDSLRKQSLISEQTAVERKRDLRLQEMDAEQKALTAKLALVKTTRDSGKEQVQIEGQIAELARQRTNTVNKAARDLQELYSKPQQDLLRLVDQGTQAIHDQAAAQEAQNAVFGQSKVALLDLTITQLEKSKADLEATNNVIPGYIEALDKQIAAQKRLRDAAAKGEGQEATQRMVEQHAQAAQRAVEVWRNKTDEIVEALMGGFKGLKSWVQREFSNMVLKPLLQPVAGAVGSLFGNNAPSSAAGSAAGSFGGSALMSGVNAAMSGFGSAAGGVAQGVFLGMGELSSLTMMEAISGGFSALASGSFAAGLGTLAGVLGPIGLGIAAIASFTGSKGGPKAEGGYGVAGMERGDVGAAKSAVDDMVAMYRARASALGLRDTTLANAGIFWAQDPEGDAQTQLEVKGGSYSRAARLGGEFENVARGDEALKTELAAEVTRTLYQAFVDNPELEQRMKDYLGQVEITADPAELQRRLDALQVTRQLTVLFGGLNNNMGKLALGSVEATQRMVELAGGVDALASKYSSFRNNYYSEAERNQQVLNDLTRTFSGLGLALPATRDEFRRLVEQQDPLTEAGAQMIAALLNVESAFAQVTPVAEGAAKSSAQIAQGVDSARSALVRSYERERDALQATKERFLDFADGLKRFRQELISGDLAGLSPTAKLAASRTELQRLAALAQAGDEQALQQLRGAGESVLSASSTVNASSEAYQADRDWVLRIVEQAEQSARAMASVQDVKLTALTAEVSQLVDLNVELNAGVLSVRDAILQLAAAEAARSAVRGAQTGTSAGAAQSAVTQLYSDLFGRTPDAEGLAYWSGQLASGKSLDYVTGEMKKSGEWVLANTPGFEGGGYHAGGLRIVGEKGKELEATGPAMYWTAQQTREILGGAGQPTGVRTGSAADMRHTLAIERQNALMERLLGTLEDSAASGREDARKVAQALTFGLARLKVPA